MSDVILRERRDAIEILTVNRPKALNALNQEVMDTLHEIVGELSMDTELRAVVLTGSGKAFVAGADIASMQELHPLEAEAFAGSGQDMGEAMNRLQVPIIAAVNGFALGGGCEMTLACDLRVADTTASIGLPEVKLGIMPGFGGTVRLPRLIGADNALEWMTTGKDRKGAKALAEGAVDAVVAPESLRDSALSMLKDAVDGKFKWEARRAQKKAPLQLNKNEAMMSFSTAQAMVFAQAGKHYPAPHKMVETVQKAAGLDRDGALKLENCLLYTSPSPRD